MKMLRKSLITVLLKILNSRFLNATPCQFGFIGNVDAFDIQFLRSEIKMDPNKTVAEIVADAERFKSCPLKHNLTVMEPDGTDHEATIWDIQELRNAFAKENND